MAVKRVQWDRAWGAGETGSGTVPLARPHACSGAFWQSMLRVPLSNEQLIR